MLRKFLWNTTALYAPEGKTAAEIREEVRKTIPVTSTKGDGSEPVNNKTETETETEVETEETEGAEGEEGTEGVEGQQEQNQEQIDANAKTAEQLEQEKKDATTQKEKDRVQRRIDRLTAKTTELELKNKELEAKLAAKPDKALSEEEVETRANQKATQITTEREFVNACNRLAKDATATDKEFKKKIDAVVDELGGIQSGGMPPHMIGMLDDMDDGGKVLAHLANDIDTYEEVIGLPMAKMATRLAKISTQIAADEAKAAAEAKKNKGPKEPSKVPNPVEPIRGGSTTIPGVYRKGMAQEDYVAMRLKQRQQREERRKAGLRA